MKWLCGVGLRPEETGPIEAAGWLARHKGEVLPFTVVRDPSVWGLDASLRHQMVIEARIKGQARIDASPGGGAVGKLEVVYGSSPEDVLCQRARELEANILIGRRSRRDDPRMFRLGSVARRVLRRLPCTVCVVPADADEVSLRSGPVVVAVTKDPGTLQAVPFGRKLAAELGEEVVFVHALGEFPDALENFEGQTVERLRKSLREKAADDVENFFAVNDMGSAQVRLEPGSAVDALLHVARERGASAIVTGSRHLTATQRLFSSSVGSTLAALSEWPVFVVPPC